MNADADFLAAIRANPDDDALRLVYADWLEERGDVRSELLRLELIVDRAAHPDLHELARLQELQHTLDRDWLLTVGRANFGRVCTLYCREPIADSLPKSYRTPREVREPSWGQVEKAIRQLGGRPLVSLFLRLDRPESPNFCRFWSGIWSGGCEFSFEVYIERRSGSLRVPAEPKGGRPLWSREIETLVRAGKYVYYFGEMDPAVVRSR